MTTKIIQTLKQQAVIADMALGFEPEIEVPHKWQVLERYHKAGAHYVGLAIAGEFTNLDTTIRYLSRHRARFQNESEKYLLVDKAADILTAKQQGKLAIGFWLQGTNPLANDIHMVDTYYRLGVRYMLLVYNTRNAIGDGLVEKTDGGLSQFGHLVIQEMNRVGMLIDLSHSGIKTSLETIEASRDPVIFSHSNAYGIAPHVRNLSDAQIKAVANKQGLIGLNSVALLLGSERYSSEKLVDHIDYMADLIGDVHHIGLGLDMVYFQDIVEQFLQNTSPSTYPTGYLGSLDSFQPDNLDALIDTLCKRHYSSEAIMAMLGGNFLRVAQQVWR